MTDRNAITAVVAILAVVGGVAISLGAGSTQAASDGETVYAKNVRGGRHLLVLKAELPKHEPKMGATGKPIPERSYEYSFVVESADGARQVVAKTHVETMPGEVERMQFQVLDAWVDGDQLVALYRAGGATYGDTALVGPRGSGFVVPDGARLAVDARESGSWVIGARLDGDLKTGDVQAIVSETVQGQTIDRRFHLVSQGGHYKWVTDPPSHVK